MDRIVRTVASVAAAAFLAVACAGRSPETPKVSLQAHAEQSALPDVVQIRAPIRTGHPS